MRRELYYIGGVGILFLLMRGSKLGPFEGSMLEKFARERYGEPFLQEAHGTSSRLGIPIAYLLSTIAIETSWFKAKGPPWPVNKHDGGGGLIGWTPLSDYPVIAAKGPAAQMVDVERYYVRWLRKLGLKAGDLSMADVYLMVRGPYAAGKPDSYDLGGGKSKGDVAAFANSVLRSGLRRA